MFLAAEQVPVVLEPELISSSERHRHVGTRIYFQSTRSDLRLHSDEELQLLQIQNHYYPPSKSFSSSPSRDGGVVESGGAS